MLEGVITTLVLALLGGACANRTENDLMTPSALDALASRWRATHVPADLVALASQLAPGTPASRVRALLGEPLVASKLANGGESWLYVKADPAHQQMMSLSVAISPEDRFLRLDRKEVD
jgi:anti-sigma-K factor RskA